MTDNPRNLQQWLTDLEPLQLPLNTQIRAQALAAIEQSCSAVALSALLLDDPAAVLLIFREANRALARYERETHGLEHAISLLGMARVQTLLQAAPSLAADHPFTREYRQAQQRSLHAAWQARLWAEGCGRWPADEMFWDTLLAGAPHWVLWLEAGSLRLQLSKLRAQRGFVTAEESHELFGCDLNTLMAQLTERWNLPRNSQLSWQREVIGKRREWIALARAARPDGPPDLPVGRLSELSHQPCVIVALANLLAVEADWDWYSRHFARLLNIVASCCRRPVSTLSNFVHQTAASFSRSYRGDLQTPAARLLCHWQQAQIWAPVVAPTPAEPNPAAAPATSTATPSAPTPKASTLADPRQLAANLRRLQQPESVQGTREALTLALDAIHTGLGLTRVAALLYRAEPRELQTLLGRGLDATPALRQLRLPVQANTLLEQLLRKPACLRLGDDNGARYLPLLPPELRSATASPRLLLASIVAAERPVALLFADAGGQPISDQQHRLFRQLALLLGQCLDQIGKPR
ncbi:MAG: HDOD domain-containing protein [Spongiibacteraceae bacterium]